SILRRQGFSFASARPRRRNQRPVRTRRGSRSKSQTTNRSGVHTRINPALAVHIQMERRILSKGIGALNSYSRLFPLLLPPRRGVGCGFSNAARPSPKEKN